MAGNLLRCLVICAITAAALATARAAVILPFGPHREDVDESRYPWSAIGKLTNETGGWCSGVVIAHDKILTAAHCVFNYRTGRFIPAESLHFLLGYRTGHYTVHARIAAYEVGPGFDPLRYGETSEAADWAVLTVTENLPAQIAPLRLSRELAPSGTPAAIVGYPQDRANAMTADLDCELGNEIDGGRLLLHTCRGVKGYSGAPILVGSGDDMRIAGIQIAIARSGGDVMMFAVPAQAIAAQAGDDDVIEPAAAGSPGWANAVCVEDGVALARSEDFAAQLGMQAP